MGGISERHKEIRRRRQRRKKYKVFKRRLTKAASSEKTVIAGKIRKISVGGEVVIENLGLQEH
ncbi:MAG: hypothetical protein FJ295_09480 [Planctomycetes bacterium]|nr:hypothetical protein [Planctomycetota bacterium]